jgi:hypothetical protein
VDRQDVSDLPPALEDRLIRALREEGLVNSRLSAFRAARRLATFAVAMSLAAGTGWFIGGRGSAVEAAAPPASQLYALLIYSDDRYHPITSAAGASARAREYGDWGRDRQYRDPGSGVRFLEGMRLGGAAAVLGAETPPEGSQPAGFFLVQASDESRAVDEARTHPHLKYGGVLVVRRVGATVSLG